MLLSTSLTFKMLGQGAFWLDFSMSSLWELRTTTKLAVGMLVAISSLKVTLDARLPNRIFSWFLLMDDWTGFPSDTFTC